MEPFLPQSLRGPPFGDTIAPGKHTRPAEDFRLRFIR